MSGGTTAHVDEARALLYRALHTFAADRIALVSAFGPGSIVLAHLLHEMGGRVPVIFVDTLHHFAETLELVERVRARFQVELRVVRAARDRAAFEAEHGGRLWERDLDGYHRLTKVEPFRDAIADLDAYITGRRNDQSASRADLEAWETGQPVRINPLASWTGGDVWTWIQRHQLPYNPLHDRGYASIGDEPLTTPVRDGEPERAGRWRGLDRAECGIHSVVITNPRPHRTPEAEMSDVKTVNEIIPIAERGYARPDVLVSTEWAAAHLDDRNVQFVESDEDPLVYETGHIPGAVKIDWVAELNDPVTRDYIDRARLEALLRAKGIRRATTLVLYGDKNNWWAAYTFWVLRLFGIENLHLLDGGRARWEQEGRPLVTDVPNPPPGDITVGERDDAAIRAFRQTVFEHAGRKGQLVDVRSPAEFSGERTHMPDYPNEGALRGGHIPGAGNVPWARAVDPDTHVFRSAKELRDIYVGEQGLDSEKETITYCRIGERSSHTWFALTYLLGFDNVRNYDGSWTEWGNLVRAPIER